MPCAGLDKGILGGGGIEGVADPGVPAGLDLGGVEVVLGVLDPAGAEGKFLVVLEELVAGAIGADETTVLGVTDVLNIPILASFSFHLPLLVRMMSGRGPPSREAQAVGRPGGRFSYIPTSGPGSPVAHEMLETFRSIDQIGTYTNLDADLGQVTERSRDGRHGCGIALQLASPRLASFEGRDGLTL